MLHRSDRDAGQLLHADRMHTTKLGPQDLTTWHLCLQVCSCGRNNCSCCDRMLDEVRGLDGRKIWRLKRCGTCNIAWNRDHNAARNLLRITEAWRAGQPRPQALCR